MLRSPHGHDTEADLTDVILGGILKLVSEVQHHRQGVFATLSRMSHMDSAMPPAYVLVAVLLYFLHRGFFPSAQDGRDSMVLNLAMASIH